MPNEIKFYDTSYLLRIGEQAFQEPFVISSITLKELENIKNSNKDENIKYSARLISNLLIKNYNKYTVFVHVKHSEEPIEEKNLIINNDTMILSDAIACQNENSDNKLIFYTNDLTLAIFASLFFNKEQVHIQNHDEDLYTGYRIVKPNDKDLISLYENPHLNVFNLLINEYIIIINDNDEVIDIRYWNGDEYKYLETAEFTSSWFGSIKPFKNDIYQKLLFDSLMRNKITMVRGKAGSGKTVISLAYLMNQLEKNKLNKIVIFCNTVASANAARLGFYPGDRQAKLLDSQIGNMLFSKFGGREGVERLIEEDQLVILPFSDIRGYDTSGMKAGIYISEAQNLDRALIKLALQRVGEDCICIIDGDDKCQVDLPVYEGHNNGMKRVSKIFRGNKIYGEVELQNIYRSQISKIADNI